MNIDFDDQSIKENLITFDVTAKVTDNDGRSHSETLRVEMDLDKQFGRVLLGDRELHQFSFGNVDFRMDSQKGEETIPGMHGEGILKDDVYDLIQDGIDDAIEQMINVMPVPDLFFGCLIKAGIASIVGQVFTCNSMRNSYGKDAGWVRQILSCLSKHVEGIAFRILWRAARCIIRLGF